MGGKVMSVDNCSMEAINQHCTSMIQIMSDSTDLTLTDLRTIQMRFKQFDALIENLAKEVIDEICAKKIDPDNKIIKLPARKEKR